MMPTDHPMPSGASDTSAQSDDVGPAWRLLTELRTRITTQDLPLRDGVEEAALKSIHDFFVLARSTVAENPASRRYSAIVIEALNGDLRPFTARWHARQSSGRLGSVDERYQFRHELHELQRKLAKLANKLAPLVGEEGSAQPPPTPPQTPGCTSRPIPFGIVPSVGMSAKLIGDINAAEAADVLKRRQHYGRAHADAKVDAVGLALSGGGIRSATFCLGVVQVLARKGVLQDVDFLSTVSGGGYLGCFINTVVDDEDPEVGLAPGKRPFGAEGDGESAAVRHLRNHSKYLSEGGLQTIFLMGFALLYGLFASLLLVLPFLMLAAAGLVGLLPNGFGSSGKTPEVLNEAARWSWLALAAAGFGYAVLRSRAALRTLEGIAGGLLAIAIVVTVLSWLPDLSRQVAGHEAGWFAAAALLPFGLGAAGFAIGPARTAGRVLLASLALAGPLFFLAALLGCIAITLRLSEFSVWLPTAVGIVLLAITTLGFNLNSASLHRYYRNRLSRTYLVSGGQDGRPVDEHDHRPLTGSGTSVPPKGPVHLINAALNVPGSAHPELRGRDADFFVFGKHYCGSTLTGWYPTAEWQTVDCNLDLGTAMAISGAAAAPHMGALTSSRYSTLLAMLNIRLGYWLRKPKSATSKLSLWQRLPATGLYFVRELTGRMTEATACVNVSDGGHIENLGIYELLRRRCRTVIAIDGECDPQHHFDGLLKLVRMAWIDLNIRIEPDLSDLRPNANGLCNAHFIIARIEYPGGEEIGRLLYIKLSMTGNESEYLRQYRREHPAFPHESTAQQLFGEVQWEAYRALGDHVGQSLFAEVLLGEGSVGSAKEWVEKLARRLGN
jgi:hypothetical protein